MYIHICVCVYSDHMASCNFFHEARDELLWSQSSLKTPNYMSSYKFMHLVHLENPVTSESMKLQTKNEPTLFGWFRTNYKYGMWPSGSSSVWQLNRFVPLPVYAWHVLFVLPTTPIQVCRPSMSCPWQRYPHFQPHVHHRHSNSCAGNQIVPSGICDILSKFIASVFSVYQSPRKGIESHSDIYIVVIIPWVCLRNNAPVAEMKVLHLSVENEASLNEATQRPHLPWHGGDGDGDNLGS